MRIATGGGNGGWTPPTVREADWVRAIRSNDRTRCAGWTASEAGSEALRRASYARLFRRRRASMDMRTARPTKNNSRLPRTPVTCGWRTQ